MRSVSVTGVTNANGLMYAIGDRGEEKINDDGSFKWSSKECDDEKKSNLSSPVESPRGTFPSPDSLNVFAAYYHGLPPGQRTTVPLRANSVVEDVCRNVVKHFNKMVILKGSGTPVYIDEEFHV